MQIKGAWYKYKFHMRMMNAFAQSVSDWMSDSCLKAISIAAGVTMDTPGCSYQHLLRKGCRIK